MDTADSNRQHALEHDMPCAECGHIYPANMREVCDCCASAVTRAANPQVRWDLKPEGISDADWIGRAGIEYRRAHPTAHTTHPTMPGFHDTWHNGWLTCGRCEVAA